MDRRASHIIIGQEPRSGFLSDLALFMTSVEPHQYLLFYLFIQPILGFTKNEELDLFKHLFNRVFVLLLMIYTILTLSSRKGRIVFEWTGLEKQLLFYAGSVTVSTVAAIAFGDTSVSRSVASLITLPVLISLVYVVCHWIDRLELLKTAVRYFILSAVMVSLYGLLEFFMTGFSEGFGSERVRSVFSDPNIFARYILIGIFFIAPFLFYRDESIFKRKILAGIFSLLIVNLLLSLSRSGYLALIVGGIVFSFFIDNRKIKSAVIGGSVIAGLLIFTYLLTQRSFSGTAIIEPSNINRVLLILGGIDMIQTHWFLGVGYTNFANYFERHFLENYLSLSSDSFKVTGFATEIHSWVIEVWAEQGIVGLTVFIAFFHRYFSIINRAIVSQPVGTMRNILLGFFLAVVMFLFQGLFYHTFISQFFFWLIAGFGLAASQVARRQSVV